MPTGRSIRESSAKGRAVSGRCFNQPGNALSEGAVTVGSVSMVASVSGAESSGSEGPVSVMALQIAESVPCVTSGLEAPPQRRY